MDGIRMSTDGLFMRADTPSFLICGFHSLPALGKEFFDFRGLERAYKRKDGWINGYREKRNYG